MAKSDRTTFWSFDCISPNSAVRQFRPPTAASELEGRRRVGELRRPYPRLWRAPDSRRKAYACLRSASGTFFFATAAQPAVLATQRGLPCRMLRTQGGHRGLPKARQPTVGSCTCRRTIQVNRLRPPQAPQQLARIRLSHFADGESRRRRALRRSESHFRRLFARPSRRGSGTGSGSPRSRPIGRFAGLIPGSRNLRLGVSVPQELARR